jgi:hypothetical protein
MPDREAPDNQDYVSRQASTKEGMSSFMASMESTHLLKYQQVTAERCLEKLQQFRKTAKVLLLMNIQ